MKTRKVSEASRKWLTPWHFAVFAMGAVAGSILGGFYGAAYTSAAVIVTCWFAALMLVAFDRSKIIAPRSAARHWQSPTHAGGSAEASFSQPARKRLGAAQNPDAARRSRLRSIAGGKNEPPWRAS